MTGFEPFPDGRGDRPATNPSATLARALADTADTVAVLPVSWSDTVPALRRALPGHTHWIGLGLSARVRGPTLECVALNIAHSTIPDNDGVCPHRRPIDPAAPLALAPGFDPSAAQAHLADQGQPLALSHHAGTYLCNSVLFVGCQAREAGTLAQAAFLHVPPETVRAPETMLPLLRSFSAWLRAC